MTNTTLFNEQSKYTLSEFEFIHDPMDRNSKLGIGSFASVKLAKEKRTGTLFAMKMVRLHGNKQVNAELYNIKCEIFIHRRLEHPNIIKFHDYIHQDPNVYLVLDYAENGNLYTYIHKRKQLKENEIFRYFYQSCLAIQYMHQNDVFHRDIKPENLLLDADYNIKLCDFGWATQRIEDKRTTFCGTYEYMAPEIVYKKPYDYRVDIWSLGVLLYELIHRESPYKGRTLPEICRSLNKGMIKFSATCHPEAQDLIQRILKHNPTERLSLAQILYHPWVLSHLSKEENARFRPCPAPLRTLSHCSNVRQGNAIEIPDRWSKEKYEAQTTTNAQTKVQHYDTWSEYFATSQNSGHRHMKSFQESNNRSHMICTDVSPQRVLQTSRSNVNLHLEAKPIQIQHLEVQSALPDTSRTKSGSSISSMNLYGNQTPINSQHTPQKSSDETKGFFQTNIFSPSFKSKLTSIISQLTLKTPTDQTTQRMERNMSNQNLHQQPHTPQNGSFIIHNHNQSISSYCQASSFCLDDKDSVCRKESISYKNDKYNNGMTENYSQSTNRSNLQGRSPKVLDHMKNTFKERLGLPKGDELPIDPGSNSTTRTNTSDDIITSTQKAREAINKERVFFRSEKEDVIPLSQRNNNDRFEGRTKQRDKQQFVNKKTMELKNILGANIVKYQIPIPLSTTSRQGRGKENLFWN